MGQYTNKGLYNGYKKNHSERQKEDWYSTPPSEVLNILEHLQYDFSNQTILEPCCGGGHMIEGINEYFEENSQCPSKCIGTDFKDRGYTSTKWHLEYGLDFLADDYPYDKADVIIMNPPFSIIEPFMIRALEIAQSKVIMLARTQVIEGKGRYEKIFKDNPPTYVYQYIDRIQCWKNGEKPTGTSAQAYCWVIWDKEKAGQETILRHIWRK